MEQHQALAAEEAFRSLPFSGQLDAVCVCHEGASLNHQRAHVEVVVDSVAGGSGSEDDFAGAAIGGESVDDHALAAEGSSECFSDATLQASFECDARIHCGHG